MAICLMIIDAEHMLAVRKVAFSAFKRSFDFFHDLFTYSFWFLLLSEQKNRKRLVLSFTDSDFLIFSALCLSLLYSFNKNSQNKLMPRVPEYPFENGYVFCAGWGGIGRMSS